MLFVAMINFVSAGDGARINRLCGEEYDGSLQTSCWSDISGHIPVYRLRKNCEKRFERNG